MRTISINNGKDLKTSNRMLVRDAIGRRGPIARSEVARVTGLAPPTVTAIVNELIASGLVEEIGRGESSGGRRPIMLRLNPQAGFIMAMRIQRGEARVALFDLAGRIQEARRFSVEPASPQEIVETIGSCCDSIVQSAKVDRERVLWCGAALSGMVDSRQGVVERSTNLAWERVPFARMLSGRLGGIPVQLEKNTNAAAIAEKVYGSGRGCANLIYLNLSVGMGAGIIINGEVFGGACGFAGEVGHLPLMSEGGPLCTCGRHGCFEALCGIRAVLERIRTEVPEEALAGLGLNPARIGIDEATSPLAIQIPEVRKILREIGSLIGNAAGILINLFNTERIILGGELARAGDILVDAVSESVRNRVLPEMARTVRVVRSIMPEDPPLLGAYVLALDKLFAIEDWRLPRRNDGNPSETRRCRE